MDYITFRSNLNHFFVEPVQKRFLSSLTKQQKMIGAIALALFSLIALVNYVFYKKSKNHDSRLIVERVPVEPPAITLVGIPNLGNTCFINSAVLSFYPLRERLSHLNNPSIRVINEVFDNPELKAPELISIWNELYNRKTGSQPGEGGYVSRVIQMILEKIVEESPDCDIAAHGIFTFIPGFFTGPSIFTGNISEKLPEYCFVDLSNCLETPLAERYEWNGTAFKVISAVKYEERHFGCVIKKEDGNWYHFDDSQVNRINPFGQTGYCYMVLEKIN